MKGDECDEKIGAGVIAAVISRGRVQVNVRSPHCNETHDAPTHDHDGTFANDYAGGCASPNGYAGGSPYTCRALFRKECANVWN